jgi:hypothetical protein
MRRLISVFLLVPLAIQAQSGALPSDWQAVKTLPGGARVRATLHGGETANGEFAAATDEALTILRDGRSTRIARKDVSRVYRMGRGSMGKRIAIGAAVGGGIGAAAGGAFYSKGDYVKAVIPGMALIGAGAGALIGLLAGTRRTSVLVYAAYPPADSASLPR